MATAPNEVDVIRRQMAQIRLELHQDVRGVVEQAEAATDWRRAIQMYPFACMGAAFVLGFVLVPGRRSSTQRVVEVTTRAAGKPGSAPVVEHVREVERKPGLLGSLIGKGFGLLSPLAMRAAQGYAMQYLENFIAQQQAATQGGPGPAAPGPQGPGF